ncbi:MAG: sulfatase-like hydrolase/transferase, partial [Verrucomicrobiota bacterium]
MIPLLARFPLLLLSSLLALSAVFAGEQAKVRPNFVFFITDDQPYLGLSCTGNTVLKTPAMDALAAKGVLFENAFATTAICCSSRASILTGQHMRRHGIEDFAKPLSAAQLQEIFPVLLRKAGYRTAFLGKYAVGSPKVDPALSLPAELFDLWYGFPQSIAYKQIEDGKDRYLTTVMEEKAVQFLQDAQRDQPFCLIMALKEPHGPADYFDSEFTVTKSDAPIPRPTTLTRQAFDALPAPARESMAASPRWIDDAASFEAYVRKRDSYIARSDLAVGRVTAALAAAGLDENTVVIFMSDHGSFCGAHGLTGKWLMYEESIRVPLIIHDPRLPASTRGRRQSMALNIDL